MLDVVLLVGLLALFALLGLIARALESTGSTPRRIESERAPEKRR